MTRHWSRPGTILLAEDISRSDRPRLPTYRPPDRLEPLWLMLPVCLAWAVLVGLIAIIWRIWG